MSWAAVASAGVAVAGSLLGSKDQGNPPEQPPDTSYRAIAAQTGKSNAQVEMSKARALAALPAVARQVRNEQTLASMQAARDASKAASAAAVEASAAGVTGSSVDAVMHDLKRTQGEVNQTINKNAQSALAKLDQAHDDIYWNAHTQKQTFFYDGKANVAPVDKREVSTTDRLLSAALSGVSAYIGAK